MDISDSAVNVKACQVNLRARQQQRFQDMETGRLAARAAILEALRTILPLHPEVERIYLFGSVNKTGAFHPTSDIDVAVEGTNAEEYFALWHELNEVASEWEVDLRESNHPSYFADSVRQRGELVYERRNSRVIG